jgi:hypothetical protein
MSRELEKRSPVQWAGALQEGSLQGLVALRLLLVSGMNRGSQEALQSAAEDAVRHIDGEIGELRGLIAEMRSAPQLPSERLSA